MFSFVLFLSFIVSLSFGQQTCATGDSIGPDIGGCQPGTVSVDGQCCPVESVVDIDEATSFVFGGETSQSLFTTTLFPGVTSVGCVDKINPNTGTSDCPRLSYLCNDVTYTALMAQLCPHTCGRCSAASTVSTDCQDHINPKTGISDCSNNANLCTNTLYQSFMKTQCPRTCGYCSGSTVSSHSSTSSSLCADKTNPKTGVSDCPGVKSYCNKPQYASLMRTQCPSTCGFC